MKPHTWSCLGQEELASARTFAKKVLTGVSVQEALNLSDECAEKIYLYAQELLIEGKFEDAGAVLFVLTLICSDRPGVWISYGISLQNRGEYERAKAAYDRASLIMPELMEPYIYAAQCAACLHNFIEAKNYLNQLKSLVPKTIEDEKACVLAEKLKKGIHYE